MIVVVTVIAITVAAVVAVAVAVTCCCCRTSIHCSSLFRLTILLWLGSYNVHMVNQKSGTTMETFGRP